MSCHDRQWKTAKETAKKRVMTRTSRLGALALGAPGLSIWRREQSVAATPESN
jgi:hypothetical protein